MSTKRVAENVLLRHVVIRAAATTRPDSGTTEVVVRPIEPTPAPPCSPYVVTRQPCWASGPHTPWHADQYYWPLATPKTITAWIPLQETPLEMGPMEFSAGGDLRVSNTPQWAHERLGSTLEDEVERSVFSYDQLAGCGDLSPHERIGLQFD
jgi:phytanoyl-CoA dioxygenase PhyH